MFAPFVGTGPAAGASVLLTMSGSTQAASPEGWAGAANEPKGGPPPRKLSIGYLLCNEEDHHPPRAGRHVHAGPGRSAVADVAPEPRGAVELPARGAPPRPRSADHHPAGAPDAGAGRSRADERQAGHGSGGERDERERRLPPPPPRRAQPAGQGEAAARLSIPPLRLTPESRQGGVPTPAGGAPEWPRVPAQLTGRFGGAGSPQWSPRTPWSGPLVSGDGRTVPLPIHSASPRVVDTWGGHQKEPARHSTPSDQLARTQEKPPGRSERTADGGPEGPTPSTLLSEAPDAAGHRKRPLPALWHPPPPPQEDPPPTDRARPAGPDVPRQRPYLPVAGRVARAAPWPRLVGGGVGGAGLPYPPLRALHTAGRGLPSAFHGGLPPLLPPSSTSLLLADLHRPPPAAPLSRRVDHADALKEPLNGVADGTPKAPPDGDPLQQPRHSEGDSNEVVPDREQARQPPQLQAVNASGVSSSPVKAEAPPGASSHIFPTDKTELDPESATPHACDECSERFPHRSQLQSHIRNVHERAGRPFECERCGSRFRQRAHKQKHVAAVHLKEKPYTCKICLHCFGRRSDLNKHDRLVHKRERPYGCDFPGCHARFGQKGDSKKHMATHERSEARRRAAAAAVVATAAAVAEDVATSAAVAAVDDRPGRGRPHGDWPSPAERPAAVRDNGWRQTEHEWEVEDGDDVDGADNKEDDLTRPDDDGGDEEKEADDDGA